MRQRWTKNEVRQRCGLWMRLRLGLLHEYMRIARTDIFGFMVIAPAFASQQSNLSSGVADLTKSMIYCQGRHASPTYSVR